MIVDGITFYPIMDFEGYHFSMCGRVYREKSHKNPNGLIQAQITNPQGYFHAQLYINGKRSSKLIHRIIAETFLPNPNKLPFIDHINGDRKNNSLDNLRWVSRKQNAGNNKKYEDTTKGTFWQGVFYENPTKKSPTGRFRAMWSDENNKEHRAGFSIGKYGMMSLICAIDKRNEMVTKYYDRPKNSDRAVLF